jgi:GTP pyrophosphokinase
MVSTTTSGRPNRPDGIADAGDWFDKLREHGYSREQRERLMAVLDFRSEGAVGESAQAQMEHALSIAEILVQLQADDVTLAAGLLHDFGFLDEQAIRKVQDRFGREISDLVTGVARLDILPEIDECQDTSRQSHIEAENLRKMLLAMVDDVRVVLIKLAHRLYQMYQLKNQPEAVQRSLARQTLEIFAPLANRLGIWQIKWQLEDLSLRYLQPDEYHAIASALDERRVDREKYITAFIAILDKEIQTAGIQADISGRAKHIYSIYKKMQRKGVDLSQIFDVRAVRILVDSIPQCYAVLGIVHSLWPYIKSEFDDYIATPKANNYQSIHTAVRGTDGRIVEIQIRTHEMDEFCELGVASHWRYKEGIGHDEGFDQKVAWLRQLLEWKDEVADSSEFVAEFQSRVFDDRVYVFTPAGKVVDLPAGSTPLDFAYAIHTEVGHRCRGAKINDRMVPLTYELKTGERVEILTIKQGQPSRDWINPHLGYTRSHRARAKIQQWFRQQDYEQNVTDGRLVLDRELVRLGLRDINIEKLAQQLAFSKVDDMYASLGRGETRSSQIANALQVTLKPARRSDAELTLRQSKMRGDQSSDVQVLGVGSLMTHMAKCCKPVPGDDIVGYITQGRGVSVHRSDCRNVLRARNSDDKRLVEVSWGKADQDVYPVDIQILAYDRQGLLSDITALLSNERINVTAVNTKSDPSTHQARMDLTIEISDLGRLSKLLSRLNELSNVHEARRVR